MGPLESQILVVQEQQLVTGRSDHTSYGACDVTAYTIVCLGNGGRVEESQLAVAVPWRSLGASPTKQCIRARKLFRNHLIAERWDNGDPESLVASQQCGQIGVKNMLVDIDHDDPVRASTTAFPTLVRY